MQDYKVIVRDTDRELAESVRVANLSGYVAVGPLISDRRQCLQVVRRVREGYVTADGEPCDRNGRILRPVQPRRWLSGPL